MSLWRDLLNQSEHLAHLDARKPKQANLRRAVSSAYYALFHLLCEEAASRISPNDPPGLQRQIQRAFEHGRMKQACLAMAARSSSLAKPLDSLLDSQRSREIQAIARSFIALQEARHKADYDLSIKITRLEALQECQRARESFVNWDHIRDTAEANVFLCALLFWQQWTR